MQLSRSFFNFTDTQDVRLAVGYNAHIDHRGRIAKVGASAASVSAMLAPAVNALAMHLSCFLEEGFALSKLRHEE